MRKLIPKLYFTAIAGSLLLLLVVTAYCWSNESGHSSFNPMLTIYLFAPAFLIGIAGIFLVKAAARSAITLTVIGLFGMAFGIFISRLNILNEYHHWISAGMPQQNPSTGALLITFLLVTIGIATLTARPVSNPAKQGPGNQVGADIK